jgi:hypothetical protein
MDYDRDKVDQTALALMCLTMFEYQGTTRAWKGYDWDVLNRLFEKGWIGDPKSKARSVVMTPEGEKKAQELFRRFFRGSD